MPAEVIDGTCCEEEFSSCCDCSSGKIESLASGGHPRERGTTWRQSHCRGKESLEGARDQLLRMSFDEGLGSAMTETINISFGFLENFLWFLKHVLLRFLMLSTEKNSS